MCNGIFNNRRLINQRKDALIIWKMENAIQKIVVKLLMDPGEHIFLNTFVDLVSTNEMNNIV
jgi:hypothetical protein